MTYLSWLSATELPNEIKTLIAFIIVLLAAVLVIPNKRTWGTILFTSCAYACYAVLFCWFYSTEALKMIRSAVRWIFIRPEKEWEKDEQEYYEHGI